VVLDNERKKFIGFLNKNDLILDMGCGLGNDVKFFINNGFRCIGIDNSKGMLRRAKKIAPDGNFKEMDMRALKFDDRYFDAVWSKASLMHLPKSMIKSALSEVKRVLKKKGIFFLSLREGTGEKIEKIKRYDNNPRFFSYFKEDEIKRYLKGFNIIEISRYDTYACRWIAVFCRKA